MKKSLSMLLVLSMLTCASVANAGYYKFSGDITYTWNQESLSSKYRVGNNVDFVFRIDADAPNTGYVTQVDGDRASLSTFYTSGFYYAEYLGGDAILNYDQNYKATLADDDNWEYNVATTKLNKTPYFSDYSARVNTETASNLITLSTSAYETHMHPYPTVPNWEHYFVDSNKFDLFQNVKWMEGGEEMWAQFKVEHIMLMEYADEISGLNLEGINMKMTATPLPGAIWLLGSGILGLVGIRRRMKG
ncbi:VPLPA-CTERM sorting domain-containing protein [Pseudodesulfovibrio sp. zrk46]|uniref:VPLPA-CTERM sorting domain-containing protein n=1 Tax=Pseudodesulfovibrio sp. zrk46 TaxID=2725288 RepID=UPI0014494779|nr:VPLPA-CTERM sorting domain-containing protein [Pseudodesulfovibrio sp. zrk46]QJB56408.1 hypothetical protein HFN16_08265 [Pseudodesulfovibrio sp. zrk46]